MQTIYIFQERKINPCFVKANIFLITTFKETLKNSIDKNKTLEMLWKSKLHATLVECDGYYTKIVFDSYNDFILFNLKFN